MPFTKGDKNINRSGAPIKPWTMGGLLRDSLEEQDETGTSYKKIITRKLRTIATKGDMVAIKEVNNRLDGMPKQSLGLEGNQENPLVIKIVEDKQDRPEE